MQNKAWHGMVSICRRFVSFFVFHKFYLSLLVTRRSPPMRLSIKPKPITADISTRIGYISVSVSPWSSRQQIAFTRNPTRNAEDVITNRPHIEQAGVGNRYVTFKVTGTLYEIYNSDIYQEVSLEKIG